MLDKHPRRMNATSAGIPARSRSFAMDRCIPTLILLLIGPLSIASAQEPAQQDNVSESSQQNAQIERNRADSPSPRTNVIDPTLDEVVITATRRSERAFDLSYTTHTITADDIRDRSYRTTPESLRDLPGIMVQKTAHGQGAPFIRGFTSFHNLFLIDGVRLNHSAFRSGPNQYWNTVDSFSLERTEIVKGPTSVLYGSDAIGGTVNAITKSPSTYGEGINSERRLYYRYSTAERSNVGRFELDVTEDEKIGVLIGGTFKQFGDLRAGRGTGEQPNTGYDEWDADFKLEYFFTPDTRLIIAHQEVSQNNVPRTHRTAFSKSFDGTTIGSDLRRDLDQDRRLTYIQLHAENMDSFVETMRLSLSWQEHHEIRDRIRSSGVRQKQGFDVGTFGASAQFESNTPFGQLTYGAEYYHDNVNSFSTSNQIQGPIADDASYDLLGIYVQNQFAISDRLEFLVGGRLNYARADARRVSDPVTGGRTSVSDEWWSLVGNARLVWHIVPDHVNFFGGVAQGFRAPNLSDLSRFDVARTDEFETPAFGLDPENYIAFEAGIKTQYDNWSMEAAYFHTLIDDMIIRKPTGRFVQGDREVTKVNSGDGFIHGIELSTSFRFRPDWTLFGNFTWMDGEIDSFPTALPSSQREPVSRLMPLTGQIGMRWDHPKRHIWLEGLATIAGNQDNLSFADKADTSRIPPGGTPSYTVFSLRSGWRINENVDLTVAVENLGDENYRVHGSGLNEPGRSLNVGLSITF